VFRVALGLLKVSTYKQSSPVGYDSILATTGRLYGRELSIFLLYCSWTVHVQLPKPRAQDGEKDVLSTNLPYTARALTLTLIPSLTVTLTPSLTLPLILELNRYTYVFCCPELMAPTHTQAGCVCVAPTLQSLT